MRAQIPLELKFQGILSLYGGSGYQVRKPSSRILINLSNVFVYISGSQTIKRNKNKIPLDIHSICHTWVTAFFLDSQQLLLDSTNYSNYRE